LGIDFEEWFHPELIQKHHKPKSPELYISKGIDKILEWLRKNETFATFFVVGEILESKPELLDKILDNDHEIAFHTMHHTRLDDSISKESFSNELKQFSKLTNKKSKGFRAPSFSLAPSSSWVIDTLIENGYVYDSSVVPVKTRLYGIKNAPTSPYLISSKSINQHDPFGKIIEFPLLATKLLGKHIPAGGGFYLRALPLSIIRSAIISSNKLETPATFYIHSWELVPELMPKVNLPIVDNFITYYNLKKSPQKMTKIIKEFEFTSFERFLSSNLNKFNKSKEFNSS